VWVRFPPSVPLESIALTKSLLLEKTLKNGLLYLNCTCSEKSPAVPSEISIEKEVMRMHRGYTLLWRKIWSNPVLSEPGRKFSRLEAWLYIIKVEKKE